MKLLLDSCVWGGAAARLRASGHDVVWSGDWPADPGDEEILARALGEGRILVTLDKDFGELAIVRELPHGAPAQQTNSGWLSHHPTRDGTGPVPPRNYLTGYQGGFPARTGGARLPSQV